MTALSININKIATLRNARGGNIPNLIQHAIGVDKINFEWKVASVKLIKVK